jgi:hypothetical protein
MAAKSLRPEKAEGKLKKLNKNALVCASTLQGRGLGFGEQAPRLGCQNAQGQP